MAMLHISQCPLVREESIALVSYVLGDYGLKYPDLGFMEVDISIRGLDPLRVKYLMLLETEEDKTLKIEVSLLQARVDIEKQNCSAIMLRCFKNGELVDDSFALYHFYMRPWDEKTVVPLLKQQRMFTGEAIH